MARPKEVEFEVQALLSEPVKPSEQSVWVFVALHPVVPGDPPSRPGGRGEACRTTQRAQLVEVKRRPSTTLRSRMRLKRSLGRRLGKSPMNGSACSMNRS